MPRRCGSEPPSVGEWHSLSFVQPIAQPHHALGNLAMEPSPHQMNGAGRVADLGVGRENHPPLWTWAPAFSSCWLAGTTGLTPQRSWISTSRPAPRAAPLTGSVWLPVRHLFMPEEMHQEPVRRYSPLSVRGVRRSRRKLAQGGEASPRCRGWCRWRSNVVLQGRHDFPRTP